jgi:O-antigen ligase
MLATAGRILAPAVVLTALALSPALGYANTHVLLIFGAVAAVILVLGVAPSTAFGGPPPPSSTGEDHRTAGAGMTVSEARSLLDPPLSKTGEGDQRSWWRGRPQAQTTPALLFVTAFALILIAALGAMREPSDLLALVPYLAPLCFLPFAHLLGGRTWPLARLALLGAAIGLITALALRYGIGKPRAGEGSFITDPYRLSVTTLLCATLALGALFTAERWRWLSLLGLVAAAGAIYLTGSRTTLLGVPVLLFLTALCFAKRPTTIIALIVAAAALVTGALFVELPGKVRMRLWDVAGSIARGETVTDESIWIRIKLWGDGLRDFWDKPLFGHGWGDWMMAPLRAGFPQDLESLPNIAHMHNDALHFGMAGGALGLVAWLLLLAAPVVGYLTLPPEAKTRPRLHAILVLVGGYFALGLADIMLASPAQLTLYVALTAIVLATGRPETARQ